jgi:hypothetical protein
MALPPPHDAPPVVALDLINNPTRSPGHCASSGADHRPDWPSNHRAGGGADGSAGGLLPRGAGACQETQSGYEHKFLHELPPPAPMRDHPDNSGKAGQFGRTVKNTTMPWAW